MKLTHLNAQGQANMVDVGDKPMTSRTAVAECVISMLPETFELLHSGQAKKGDVLGTARLAGIMAAKKTHELIPLCHPLLLTKVEITFEMGDNQVRIEALAKVTGQTGVEMEALTAASVSALTLYDMLKAVDRSMTISGLRLLEKIGGKSGHFKAEK